MVSNRLICLALLYNYEHVTLYRQQAAFVGPHISHHNTAAMLLPDTTILLLQRSHLMQRLADVFDLF